jgi:hypothetical protein
VLAGPPLPARVRQAGGLQDGGCWFNRNTAMLPLRSGAAQLPVTRGGESRHDRAPVGDHGADVSAQPVVSS